MIKKDIKGEEVWCFESKEEFMKAYYQDKKEKDKLKKKENTKLKEKTIKKTIKKESEKVEQLFKKEIMKLKEVEVFNKKQKNAYVQYAFSFN